MMVWPPCKFCGGETPCGEHFYWCSECPDKDTLIKQLGLAVGRYGVHQHPDCTYDGVISGPNMPKKPCVCGLDALTDIGGKGERKITSLPDRSPVPFPIYEANELEGE